MHDFWKTEELITPVAILRENLNEYITPNMTDKM